MSLRCWTAGSAADIVPATWLALVARMAAQMQKAIGNCKQCIHHKDTYAKAPNVTTHCYCTFGVAKHWLYQYWINPQMWWMFCSFVTTLQNMVWHTWPPTKLQKLLLSFCDKVISQSLEHQPSSCVTDEPTLKATSSENFASLWAYRRLGLHLTMLKPMDRWSELTKHWCAW